MPRGPCCGNSGHQNAVVFRTAGSQLPLREDVGHGVAPSLNGLPPIESGVTADPEQDPVHRMSRLCVRIHMRSSIVFTARRVAQTAIRRRGRDQVLILATLKLALLGDAIVVVPSIADFVEQGLLSLIGLGGHALGLAVT